MISFKKAGSFTPVLLYKIRKAGVWTDVATGYFNKAGVYTLYYEPTILERPAAGTYTGAAGMVFLTDGTVKSSSAVNGSLTITLGRWRTAATPYIGATVEIRVTHYLSQGDVEEEDSGPLNTWVTLYPGSTIHKWWAEDSTSTTRAVFKIEMRDDKGNLLDWYADFREGGPGIISHAPIVWSSGGGGDGGGGTDPGGPPGDIDLN